ncbi:MAG: 16S rRNA (cytosine(1402)-N(4))-methyltransferase RsmH [Desulfobacteraceae bacterium]
MAYPHQPVLVQKVVRDLITAADGIYVDGTVGNGGHSKAIGEKISAKGRLICLDRDSEAVRLSSERLSPLGERVSVLKGNYAELIQVLKGLGIEKVNGIFLDLGISSHQLEKSGRGFSFQRDERLDMRMDLDDKLTAHHIINTFSPKELEQILRDYGEEKRARKIVKSVERVRSTGPIDSSLHLAELIRSEIPVSRHPRARHPATRTFQALRIAVNRELENLKALLDRVPPLLYEGGRLVIISYHSLEDRMVKQAMMNWERGCTCPPDFPYCRCGKVPLFKRVHKRGTKPDPREVEMNPRARSATLRAAERI